MALAKPAALAKQRAGPAVAKAHPVVRRGDLGQAPLQHGVPADGVEGVAYVDLQDNVICVTFRMFFLD